MGSAQQTVVNDSPDRGLPGLVVDSQNARSFTRANPGAPQITTVVITEQNTQLYTLLIDGIPATFTSDASGTKLEIATGLKASIDANAFILAIVSAAIGGTGGSETLVLTGGTDGQAIVVDDTDVNLAATETQAAQGALPYGVAVTAGNGDKEARLPTDAADIILGIVQHDPIEEQQLDGTTEAPIDSAISIVHEARILVAPELAVTDGDPVFVRHTPSGVNTQRGALRNDADSATALALPNARFRTTTSAAGELAELSLNLPG